MTTATIAPMRTVSREARDARDARDARPIIPRNQTNLWTKAEKVRDELYARVSDACRNEGLDALIICSGPYVFPAWVKFEAWQPREDAGTTERSSVVITIDPKPYHAHEFELEVVYTARNKTTTLKRVRPLSAGDVQALIVYLLKGGQKPALPRFRESPLQFWRENNKLVGLRTDVVSILFAISIMGGFLLLPVPLLSIVMWGAALLLYLQLRKRKWIVRIDGKPDGEPRALIRVDSWQAVLFNLGNEEAMVRERLLGAFEAGLAEHGRFHSERAWYWGLDGKQEREQLVLTAGRGIVFCQLYAYGQDLYVGWDGHLNRGQWVEQTVASGIEKPSGNSISISRVVPGTQPTTDYDFTDLSCLMEWAHAQIVKVLKQLIDEKKIDQEIDFKIQRAERQQVVASGAAEVSDKERGKTKKKTHVTFQRTA